MKIFKIKTISILFFLVSISSKAYPQKEASWTLMIYAQADPILNNFAIKNFNAMATIGSNEKMNLIIQWNQPNKNGVWRYKIEKNKLNLVDSAAKKHPSISEDLANFVGFAAHNYPAKNYALIFWNHGVGILDPEWSQLSYFAINPSILSQYTNTRMEGIDQQESKNITNDAFKGVLFDFTNKTYLTSQGLGEALNLITKNILKKKLSLIGMDACLMSMLEIFYQIKDFADYCVSSEEVEHAQGWNYVPFLYALSTQDMVSSQLAKNIVSSYEDLYKNKMPFYTQSAIELNKVDYLINNVNQVVGNIYQCMDIDKNTMDTVITYSRQQTLQLSTQCYIDLHSFYTELEKQISDLEKSDHSNQQNITPITSQKQEVPIINRKYARRNLRSIYSPSDILISSEQLQNLKRSIFDGKKIIENIVIANVSSPYLSRAKGISIYYPNNKIDPSYSKTKFAQKSLWLDFIQRSIEK